MEEKVNYAIVGLFVLLLGLAFIAIVLWLSSGAFTQPAHDRYLAFFRESVSGLSVNAPVKYRGVEVGRVRELGLSPGNPEEVRLVLDIREGTPVKTDTHAVLSVQGLTGIAFIELTGGSREAPLLKAEQDQRYPVIPTGPSLLLRFDTALSSLTANLNRVTGEISGLLTEENRRAFTNILANLDTVSRTLASRNDALARGLEHAADTLEHSARTTAELPQLVERIGRSAEAVQAMANEMAGAGKGLRKAVESGNRDLERFAAQTLPEFAGLLSELRELTATLQRVGRQLEQDPSILLRGRSGPAPGPGE